MARLRNGPKPHHERLRAPGCAAPCLPAKNERHWTGTPRQKHPGQLSKRSLDLLLCHKRGRLPIGLYHPSPPTSGSSTSQVVSKSERWTHFHRTCPPREHDPVCLCASSAMAGTNQRERASTPRREQQPRGHTHTHIAHGRHKQWRAGAQPVHAHVLTSELLSSGDAWQRAQASQCVMPIGASSVREIMRKRVPIQQEEVSVSIVFNLSDGQAEVTATGQIYGPSVC